MLLLHVFNIMLLLQVMLCMFSYAGITGNVYAITCNVMLLHVIPVVIACNIMLLLPVKLCGYCVVEMIC